MFIKIIPYTIGESSDDHIHKRVDGNNVNDELGYCF